MHYADEMLNRIKSKSISRTRQQLAKLYEKNKICHHTNDECTKLADQYNSYATQVMLALDRALFGPVRSGVKFKLHNNGFHDLGEAELKEYINNNYIGLLEISRGSIADVVNGTPLKDNPPDTRFSKDEGRAMFEEWIKQAINYHDKEMAKLDKTKAKYKLFGKRIFK